MDGLQLELQHGFLPGREPVLTHLHRASVQSHGTHRATRGKVPAHVIPTGNRSVTSDAANASRTHVKTDRFSWHLNVSTRLSVSPPGYKSHTDCLLDSSDLRDRFATILVYLRDVHSGGETEFPGALFRVQTKRKSTCTSYSLTRRQRCRVHVSHQSSLQIPNPSSGCVHFCAATTWTSHLWCCGCTRQNYFDVLCTSLHL